MEYSDKRRKQYRKLYYKIIRKAIERDKKKEFPTGVYRERHHIFPVTIYGENEIKVPLTMKEHFIVHHLYARWRNDHRGIKGGFACTVLRAERQNVNITSSVYKEIDGYRALPLDDFHKKQISDSLMGHVISEEQKEKLRERMTGMTLPAFWREAISIGKKGKLPRNMSITHTCPNCGRSITGTSFFLHVKYCQTVSNTILNFI